VQRGSPSSYDSIAVSTMRKVIAQRLLESKTTIPHAFSSVSVTLDSLLKLREGLKGMVSCLALAAM
jgi:pyruvate/2-oxoglutarate dehydrogenase complex dihydrolipoamide acyltransferase (E2) component